MARKDEVTLVLGGARSGKSRWAEDLAAASGRPVLYVATAAAGDAEMAERIAAHRRERPEGWRTIEEQVDLVAAVRGAARPGDLILVDCLTLWVGNVLLREIGDRSDPGDVAPATWAAIEGRLVAAAEALVEAARTGGLGLVLVSNEVGLGVVPPFPLGRHYRDALGRVNQAVAALADDVVLMVAGLPLDLRRLVAAPAHADAG